MHSPTLRSCFLTASAGAMVAAALGLVLVYGCQRSPTVLDNSNLVVQPGVGISNLCGLGMTFAQIRKTTGDATTHGIHYDGFWRRRRGSWGHGPSVLIPSLAAITDVGEDQPISSISFHLRPYRAPLIPGLEIEKPFRGKLGSSLSFKDSPTAKLEIEKIFGPVSQVASNGAEALAFRQKGERFGRQRRDSVEELWYPDKGIAFVFETNVLTSFRVYKPIGTNR
jgi:hypothetical protein